MIGNIYKWQNNDYNNHKSKDCCKNDIKGLYRSLLERWVKFRHFDGIGWSYNTWNGNINIFSENSKNGSFVYKINVKIRSLAKNIDIDKMLFINQWTGIPIIRIYFNFKKSFAGKTYEMAA